MVYINAFEGSIIVNHPLFYDYLKNMVEYNHFCEYSYLTFSISKEINAMLCSPGDLHNYVTAEFMKEFCDNVEEMLVEVGGWQQLKGTVNCFPFLNLILNEIDRICELEYIHDFISLHTIHPLTKQEIKQMGFIEKKEVEEKLVFVRKDIKNLQNKAAAFIDFKTNISSELKDSGFMKKKDMFDIMENTFGVKVNFKVGQEINNHLVTKPEFNRVKSLAETCYTIITDVKGNSYIASKEELLNGLAALIYGLNETTMTYDESKELAEKVIASENKMIMSSEILDAKWGLSSSNTIISAGATASEPDSGLNKKIGLIAIAGIIILITIFSVVKK